MPLETATYIDDLVPTNPAHTDQLSAADGHIRLIKAALKNTFAAFTDVALESTQAQIDAAVTFSTSKLFVALAGTAGVPSISFDGDPDTGFYSTAANKIGVTLGGVLGTEFSGAGIDIKAGSLLRAGVNVFPLKTADIDDVQITSAKIADDAVTYAKLQNVANAKLLGNFEGSDGNAHEYGLGAGLSVLAGNLTAPAFPPSSSHKSLVIKVLTNTTVSVAADYVTVTDGAGAFLTLPFSGTINMATTGVNALDTGSIAPALWYYVHAIAKPDGTKGLLVSLSATAPTLPSGYTLFACLGELRTAAATAQLMGTWQFDLNVFYILGLAQTTSLKVIASGIQGSGISIGTTGTPGWAASVISAVVPPTASHILMTVSNTFVSADTNTASIGVAPSNTYGGLLSANPAPYMISGNGGSTIVTNTIEMLLESANVYIRSDTAGGLVVGKGWKTNLL